MSKTLKDGRMVVTTTISRRLWEHLHDTKTKLARWIDEKEHDSGAESAGALHERIDRLVTRLNEQCRARMELEQRMAAIEKRPWNPLESPGVKA